MIKITETLEYQNRTVRAGEIVIFNSKVLKDDNVYAEIINLYKYNGGIKIYVCILDTIDKNHIGSYWYISINKVTFMSLEEQAGLREVIEVINE